MTLTEIKEMMREERTPGAGALAFGHGHNELHY